MDKREMYIDAILTGATCGEACWTAREDICRCSCGGANHGCLRTEDGVQPTRTAKINGVMMRLVAVGNRRQFFDMDHRLIYHPDYVMETLGVVHKAATDSQIAKWLELAPYRDVVLEPGDWQLKPRLLWCVEGREYTVPTDSPGAPESP